MNNTQIAEIFEDIAGLLEIKGEQVFTVRAYQRAARSIYELPTELDQIVRENGDLKQIPGIGRAIADKITELVNTGGLRYHDRLRSEFPEGILDLMQVLGVGPRTAKRLWEELGVSNVAELESAARDGSLAALPRMGQTKVENILREIQSIRT
jgi:DNA polymerase (family 10)